MPRPRHRTADALPSQLRTRLVRDNDRKTQFQQQLRNICHNDTMAIQNNTLLTSELRNLPPHYYDTFSDEFLELLAALRLHGFMIQRADEALPVIPSDQDLWVELGHPSIWLGARGTPLRELRAAEPGSAEQVKYINQVIRANLSEQRRLLTLLDDFYADHVAASFYARLIADTTDYGETYLRSQGACVRTILEDPQQQELWLKDSQAELIAFTEFLASRL